MGAMVQLQRGMLDFRSKMGVLAEQSECLSELVSTVSTLEDLCAVQRACLSDDAVVSNESIARAIAAANIVAAASQGEHKAAKRSGPQRSMQRMTGGGALSLFTRFGRPH